MCGFGGILKATGQIDQSMMHRIAMKVAFRGPDNCRLSVYDDKMQKAESGTNALFFNRLAILDLDHRSDQPFEDERYALIFNGEIYNYAELKKSLNAAGYQFRTTSDTEVLFYALQHWGEKAINRLNGMFAFCWIDKFQKQFIVARDRMGIKPLYYSTQGHRFIFASDLDSVIRLSDKPQRIDQEAVNMFLWMQFIPTPYTIMKDIFKLPPGHYIKGDLNEIESGSSVNVSTFWDAYSKEHQTEGSSATDQGLEQVLLRSLSRQLVADVPLGLFLSSGTDSSLLAAMVNKHFAREKDFHFFTISFSEDTISDESKVAGQYINGFKNPFLHHQKLNIDPVFIRNHLEDLYDFFDEPFGDHAALLNWVISRKAKEYVTVALSGDGADELFWGYKRYEQWQHPSILLFDKWRVPGSLGALIKPFLGNSFLGSKANLEMEPDAIKRHFTLFLHPALRHLIKDPIWRKPIWAMKGINNISCRRDLVAWLDLKTYLADAMLHKVDRASMAASLEVRVPYLDNEVVDYALSLPFRAKSNTEFSNKAIIKQLLKQLAPHYNIHRPKKGFNFPIDHWLRFKWRDLALSVLNKQSLQELGLDGKAYMKMTELYYGGESKYCIPVWYILNLVLWKRKFDKITP